MGRYTTVQTFTDQDAKAAISYSAATTSSKEASHYGPGDTSSTANTSGNGGGVDKHGEPKVAINRVENVSGSSAGAGSGDFHMYRAARRRELDRVERMETVFAQKKVQEEFERKRVANMSEFEARAHKRAEKRRRRKERTKARSIGDDNDSSADEEEEKKSEKQPASKKQKVETKPSTSTGLKPADMLPETPGGVPEIANDGSFLARMLAEQKQKQKKKSPVKQDESE